MDVVRARMTHRAGLMTDAEIDDWIHTQRHKVM